MPELEDGKQCFGKLLSAHCMAVVLVNSKPQWLPAQDITPDWIHEHSILESRIEGLNHRVQTLPEEPQ